MRAEQDDDNADLGAAPAIMSALAAGSDADTDKLLDKALGKQ
jgi:hypothetical protein